jgi:hypothetical protein
MGVMTDTRDDEKFEEFLQREARGINVPRGEVPREAMWAAIEQARAARRGAARTTARPPMLRYAPWIGMAATLLLGVGLGRFVWNGRAVSTDAGAASSTVAAAGSMPGQVSPDVAGTSMDTGSSAAPVDGNRATDAARPVPVFQTAATPSTPRTSPRTTSAPAFERDDRTYRVASDQHLSRAEALVAVVAATSADATMDSLTAKWARDILTNTRLLLDSPAGEDPVRRKLLEDLETVLVQLVQRSGRTEEDRAMLDRTLQRTQLLTRLRSGAAGT